MWGGRGSPAAASRCTRSAPTQPQGQGGSCNQSSSSLDSAGAAALLLEGEQRCLLPPAAEQTEDPRIASFTSSAHSHLDSPVLCGPLLPAVPAVVVGLAIAVALPVHVIVLLIVGHLAAGCRSGSPSSSVSHQAVQSYARTGVILLWC